MRSLVSLALSLFIVSSLAIGCAVTEETEADEATESDDVVAANERQKVMDALRERVKPDLKDQDIVFNVKAPSFGHLKVEGQWAMLVGKMEIRGTGKPIDYRGTRYQEMIDEGAFEDHIDALLKKTEIGWVVKAYAIGNTDVAWFSWPSDYGAPRSVFPGG